jgi:hypothetical protein
MDPDDFAAAVEQERNAGDARNPFYQLLYNEQNAPAEQWFGQRGWIAVPTPLADYLRRVDRPVPGPDTDAGPMVARNTLVSAVKG